MHAIRSVLVALHASKPESPAQELAVRWASRSGAELTGLAVVDETVAEPAAVPIGGGAFKQEERDDLLSRRRRLVRESQDAFAGKCRAAKATFRVEERAGVPHEILAREVQAHDLAIVDREPPEEYGAGESPLEAIERLIKASSRPVVAVPDGHRPGSTALVAFDGSTPAARALFGWVGSGLASLGDAVLLTVDSESEQAARSRAQSGLDYLRRHQIDVAFRPVVSGRSVSEIICEEATRANCELIVMGPHGRSLFVEFFLGSVTKEVLGRAEVPVVLYH